MNEWLIKIYTWFRSLPTSVFYTKAKQWLRESAVGRILDRAGRMLVIGVLIYFVEHWTIGANPIPLFQTAISIVAVGVIDKVKNELLSYLRTESDNLSGTGITKL